MLFVIASSGAFASTSAQTINIKEKLPDGEYIVQIDGIEQRTITADHARDIAARKAELEKLKTAYGLCDAEVGQLKISLDLSKKDSALASTQAQLQSERADKFRAMFEGERNLRLQSERLNQRGRVAKFFDNPYAQIGFKIALPFAQTWLTARRN